MSAWYDIDKDWEDADEELIINFHFMHSIDGFGFDDDELEHPNNIRYEDNDEIFFFKDENHEHVQVSRGIQEVDHAFYENHEVRTVKFDMPCRVKRINAKSFYNAHFLETIDLPGTLQFILSYAFEGCVSLRSIEIPESLEFIGVGAFENCRRLQSVMIPKTAKLGRIEHKAFQFCSRLCLIDLPVNI